MYITYHQTGGQHLQRYLTAFTGRNNVRNLDVTEHMGWISVDMNRRILPWHMLDVSAITLAYSELKGDKYGTISLPY